MSDVTTSTLNSIALGALGMLFSLLWWLVRQKDAVTQHAIEKLWEKHDEDADRLQQLELEIAQKHYVKTELDARFDRLDESLHRGLGDLGAKLDKMAAALTHTERN